MSWQPPDRHHFILKNKTKTKKILHDSNHHIDLKCTKYWHLEFKPHLCDTYPTRLGTGAQNAPCDSCKLTSLLTDCVYVWFQMFPFRIGYRGFAEAVLICKPYIFSGNALIWNFVSQIYLFAINVHFPSLIHIYFWLEKCELLNTWK